MKHGFEKCDICGKEYAVCERMLAYNEMNLGKVKPVTDDELFWKSMNVCCECCKKINNFIAKNLVPKE